MFTDCPSCQRQFRIRADQISAAGGLVQCGYCGQQFNALERLHDRPLPLTAAAGDRPGGSGDEEGWFEVPGPEEKQPQAAESPVSGERPGTDQGGMQPRPETLATEDDAVVPPEWLLEEDRPRAGRVSRLLWLSGILILALALTVQLAWFNRDRLLDRFPVLIPYARQVCEHFQCDLIRHRDIKAIEVVNRDVRDHPRYRDALLVNATISNRSSELQPFPVIQLSLFDTAGRIIAYRRFKPDVYLDESINIERGMPPDKPVHIVLEVTGPTEGAVSFEFRFLKHG